VDVDPPEAKLPLVMLSDVPFIVLTDNDNAVDVDPPEAMLPLVMLRDVPFLFAFVLFYNPDP